MRYGPLKCKIDRSRWNHLLDEARACGRMGATRPSDTCLFGDGIDPTQTFIGLVLDQFEVGKKERGNAG